MAEPYSVQLFAQGLTESGDLLLFTAAPAKVTIIRDASFSPAFNAQALNFFIVAGAQSVSWVVTQEPTLDTFHWQGRQVLNPGDQVHVFKFTTDPLGIVISGYELEL